MVTGDQNMAEDPLALFALEPLRELLARYQRVTAVLASSVDALESGADLRTSEPVPNLRIQRTTRVEDSDADPETDLASSDLGVALAFQERLSEVHGVTRVTIANTDAGGFRFFVEMDSGDG